MPIFRCNLIDNAVWLWVRTLIEEPEAFADGLRGLQEETRQKNRALFDRLELIESQLAETEKQENKLLDLYLSGDFPKEVLLERKNRLAKLTADLSKTSAPKSVRDWIRLHSRASAASWKCWMSVVHLPLKMKRRWST